MGRLKVLPAALANRIAAGEVVQRPASVVKELMENAVDAGATRIDVVVTDSGRTMIQVIDDGCGMSPSDAVLCFERHATSKIATSSDLERILTYGFRGEALPSIAAVSEVTLRTRRKEDETATQVVISGDGSVRTSSVSAPVGSSFTVRNLFFNTPARRKFLKSDAIELKHIVEEFSRVAIPRTDITFTLSHNGRELYVLRKAKGLKFRIQDLLGSGVSADMVDVSADTGVVRVSGFTGRPEGARKAPGNQYFFVGGRYFRSSYLHKAVMKAYAEFIPEGLIPSYFIFLEVDPSAVDVNIHPTKTEIKFEDDNVIFQVLYACVREALGRNSFGASLDFDAEGAVKYPAFGRSFGEYKPVTEPTHEPDPSYNPLDDSRSSRPATADGTDHSYAAGGLSSRRQDYSALFQSIPGEDGAFIVKGRWIAARSASGLMLVNVRRAWERILYERSLHSLSGDGHVTQTAMFPVRVEVGMQARLVLEANASMLSSLGFSFTPDGDAAVLVEGVPEGYSCSAGEVGRMLGDLLLILSDGSGALEEVMRAKTAAKFAMLGAANAQVPSTPVAIRSLLDALFACDNSEFTPNGKRIVSVLGEEEIDKRFA